MSNEAEDFFSNYGNSDNSVTTDAPEHHTENYYVPSSSFSKSFNNQSQTALDASCTLDESNDDEYGHDNEGLYSDNRELTSFESEPTDSITMSYHRKSAYGHAQSQSELSGDNPDSLTVTYYSKRSTNSQPVPEYSRNPYLSRSNGKSNLNDSVSNDIQYEYNEFTQRAHSDGRHYDYEQDNYYDGEVTEEAEAEEEEDSEAIKEDVKVLVPAVAGAGRFDGRVRFFITAITLAVAEDLRACRVRAFTSLWETSRLSSGINFTPEDTIARCRWSLISFTSSPSKLTKVLTGFKS